MMQGVELDGCRIQATRPGVTFLLKPQCPRALPAKAVIIEITRQIRLALTSAL